MIERQSFDVFNIICDECGHQDEFSVNHNWDTLMDEMSENGWESRKINDEWYNFCSSTCRKKHEEDEILG